MIPYILVVAVLNFCLGFAVALYLGRAPRTALAAAGDRELGLSLSPAAAPSPPAAGPPPPAAKLPAAPGPCQHSVANLQSEAVEYHKQLKKTETGLFNAANNRDAGTARSCLESLEAVTQEYLRQWADSHGSFEELLHNRPEFNAVREQLREAVHEQDEHIESTTAAIKVFDFKDNLADDCRQMSERITRLLEANHRLRKTLGEAMDVVIPLEQAAAAAVPA